MKDFQLEIESNEYSSYKKIARVVYNSSSTPSTRVLAAALKIRRCVWRTSEIYRTFCC